MLGGSGGSKNAEYNGISVRDGFIDHTLALSGATVSFNSCTPCIATSRQDKYRLDLMEGRALSVVAGPSVTAIGSSHGSRVLPIQL